ncbi:hypothetical protein ACVXHB_24585 [Escherichia coli]
MKIVNNEVWLRAASMAEGYWRNGQLVSLVNDEGWYVTRHRETHNGKPDHCRTFRQSNSSVAEKGIQPEEVERNRCTSLTFWQAFIVPLPTRSLVIDRWR